MKNLVTTLRKEYAKNRKAFKALLNENPEHRAVSQYGTPAKLKSLKGKELKAYLLKRYDDKKGLAFNNEVASILDVMASGKLIRLKISVTWSKSATWGANPTAEIWAQYDTPNGIEGQTYTSRSIGGCGYDKLSTAIAEALNQIPQLKRELYTLKNKKHTTPNRELFGYGSGYATMPYFEGGIGVSCYYSIFEKIGFKFSNIASGKNFDVYTVERV